MRRGRDWALPRGVGVDRDVVGVDRDIGCGLRGRRHRLAVEPRGRGLEQRGRGLEQRERLQAGPGAAQQVREAEGLGSEHVFRR